jgi:hypothetical protein
MEIEATLPGMRLLARLASRLMRKNAIAQQQRFKRVMDDGLPGD